jgi:hypothetical protein
MLKRLVVGVAGVATAGAVWMGVAGEDHTTRDKGGQITNSGQLGAFVTKVGDCMNDFPHMDPGGGATVKTVTGVSCAEAHHWQVFDKQNLTLSIYDKNLVIKGAELLCWKSSKALVLTMSQSKLSEYQNSDTTYMAPTQPSWEKGDRMVDCIVGSYSKLYYESIL